MPHSAGSLPPDYRHSRLTAVRRGCKTVTIRRDSWRSHVHRTLTAQRVQLFKLQSGNVGGRGDPSPFSGGFKGGILFGKRISPLHPQEKGIRLAVWSWNHLFPSGMGMPARGKAAFSIAIRLASASIIRCRSAHLVEVRSNHRLPPVPTMRRAKQCRIRQAVCRPTTVTRASR